MKTLKQKIKTRLTDDADYIALMGTPGEEPYQTYWYKPPVKPTFPETVLNFQTAANNTAMGKDLLAGQFPLSINVWSKDDACEDIVKRIVQLLHQKPETVTTGFRAIYIREQDLPYDDDFNVYGKNVMFNVHYGRALL